MNVFKLKVGNWDGDECTLYTNLKEDQIRKVLEPMVLDQDAYPNKIVLSNFSYRTTIQL
jgi:hypothetical protein